MAPSGCKSAAGGSEAVAAPGEAEPCFQSLGMNWEDTFEKQKIDT